MFGDTTQIVLSKESHEQSLFPGTTGTEYDHLVRRLSDQQLFICTNEAAVWDSIRNALLTPGQLDKAFSFEAVHPKYKAKEGTQKQSPPPNNGVKEEPQNRLPVRDCSAVPTKRDLCQPGSFGSTCQLNISSYFPHHDVYADMEPKPLNMQGWAHADDAWYAQFINMTRPDLVIEVGVWKGVSAIALGSAMKTYFQGGTLVTVDTWLGAIEFVINQRKRDSVDPQRDMEYKNGWPNVYHRFLSNVVLKGLKDYVVPLPMTSRMAHDILFADKVQADLIHLDAAHEYADVKEDIDLWWGMLRPGGVFLGDDYNGRWPGVMQAAQELAARENVKLHNERNKFWIVKCATP